MPWPPVFWGLHLSSAPSPGAQKKKLFCDLGWERRGQGGRAGAAESRGCLGK